MHIKYLIRENSQADRHRQFCWIDYILKTLTKLSITKVPIDYSEVFCSHLKTHLMFAIKVEQSHHFFYMNFLQMIFRVF